MHFTRRSARNGGASLALLLTGTLIGPPVAATEPATGLAKARDEWTIAIGGVRVRLAGIVPAPAERRCEDDVSCAQAALALLATQVDARRIRCTRDQRLGHGVYLGRCTLEGGDDPAEILLRAGLAEPTDKAPDPYLEANQAARAAGVGLYAD